MVQSRTVWCALPKIASNTSNSIAGDHYGLFRKARSNFEQWMLIVVRSEEHTSELQSLMRISYADFCLKKKRTTTIIPNTTVTYSIYHTYVSLLLQIHSETIT